MRLGKNATLVCLGASITEDAAGFVTIVRNMLAAGYPERNIRVINAGIGGNRSVDLLPRLERDVIAHRPNMVLINVGVNDAGHGFDAAHPDGDGPNGISPAVYEAALTQIVDTLREATDAEILLTTPTIIGEDVDNPHNRQNASLAHYVAAVQRIAKSRQTLLAPFHEDFVQALRAGQSATPDFVLTTDGVHPNAVGSHVLALSVLSALGFGGL